MFEYAFFDLDGTLTDPSLGITNSIMHALRRMGKPVPPRKELYRFIGPPLIPAFEEFLGMTRAEASMALEYYREYFGVTGLFENTVYFAAVSTAAILFISALLYVKNENWYLVLFLSPDIFSAIAVPLSVAL